jgi:hypothetical protein
MQLVRFTIWEFVGGNRWLGEVHSWFVLPFGAFVGGNSLVGFQLGITGCRASSQL